jgi:hypothetical protein
MRIALLIGPWKHDYVRATGSEDPDPAEIKVADQMKIIDPPVVLNNFGEHHRHFFPLLPYIVVGSVDSDGAMWATILAGAPGFLQLPGESTLRVKAKASRSDPARAGLSEGCTIGVLGIDLRSLGQTKLTGRVHKVDDETFDVDVDQIYKANFRYIYLRNFLLERNASVASAAVAEVSSTIGERARAMIQDASTVFIASFVELENGLRHVDVSNKTGRHGFVSIDNTGVVTIPGFSGGLYFQALGNVLVNPRCGLVFVDFASGDVLQLSGKAVVAFDSTEATAFRDAGLLMRFIPETVVFRKGVLPIRWKPQISGASRRSMTTHDCADYIRRLREPSSVSSWRRFRVEGIIDESPTIRSLYLEPVDGGKVIPQKAGQHLPIRVRLPGTEDMKSRRYTLCCSPGDEVYRITVKRQGAVSRYLHSLKEGDVIEAGEPLGSFTIDARSTRLAVFLVGGIGITPALAMLRQVVYEGSLNQMTRPSWLIYSARSKEAHAFGDEIYALCAAANGAVRVTRVLSDASTAQQGDFEVAGRIDAHLLKEILPVAGYRLADECDFYLCGPGTFMQDLYESLRALGVVDDRIHTEVFDQTSFRRH